MEVTEHYRTLLAEHYTWMLGGDVEAVAEQDRRALEALGIAPAGGAGIAVDLGCGPGPQTLALADMGFGDVTGIDTSEELLAELGRLTRERPAVHTHVGDLVDSLPDVAAPNSVDVIVCMRDTLLHLTTEDRVALLLARAADALTEQGRLVLTYRDLTRTLTEGERFLPVRSDADRIMVCFLEYDDHDDRVKVNDLVHTRTPDGWVLRTSSYRKLRIAPERLVELIRSAGLEVLRHDQGPSGLWTTVAAPTDY